MTVTNPTPSGTDAADAAAAGAGDDLLRRLAEDASFLESKGFIISSIREARARIRELEAERQWRPIESAPKDGTSIIYLDGRECIGEAFWQDKDEHEPSWWDEANTEEVKPMYWTPLPDLPAAVPVAQRAAAQRRCS